MFKNFRLFPQVRAAMALFALAWLAACSQTDIGPTFTEDAKSLRAETFECCFEPEKFYPAPVAKLAMALGNEFGLKASEMAYSNYEVTEYPGRLTGKADAAEAILSRLRPLDIMVVGNTSYTLGRLMPGRFTHSLVYVGTEAELRAAGLWHLPELAPYHDEIRAGKTMIESASPDVHLVTPEKSFEVDRVLAMRPRLTAAERREAARRLFGAIGTPFNYQLGLDPNNERMVCTALIDYAMPSVGIRKRVVYGQLTILPDDIATQAINGDRLEILTYVLGNRGPGFERRSTFALMVDIASYWGVPGTASDPRLSTR